MTGLAALSATHWARDNVSDPAPVLAFALGVMPNLGAAFAMPLILASLLPATSRTPLAPGADRNFRLLLVFTTLGLLAWEVFQLRSDRFVFDAHDIAATLLGAILAYASYRRLSTGRKEVLASIRCPTAARVVEVPRRRSDRSNSWRRCSRGSGTSPTTA